VDALRGLAILGVMLVHACLKVPNGLGKVRDFGAAGTYGVQLFFVVSAFTLCWSLRSRSRGERKPLHAFFVRRVFRIGPLFWIAVAFYVWQSPEGRAFWAPNGIGVPHVLSTLAFLHGWYPTTANSVVPGGWSIAAEFTFYLCLPLLFSRVRSLSSALWLTLIATIAAAAARGGELCADRVAGPELGPNADRPATMGTAARGVAARMIHSLHLPCTASARISTRGKSMQKIVPPDGTGSMLMLPPMRCTARRATVKPTPSPG
jgi:peptidoglycan/LPS O-acetylase OafA/YrhL